MAMNRSTLFDRLDALRKEGITFTQTHVENVSHRMGAGGGYRVHLVTEKQTGWGGPFVSHPSLWVGSSRTAAGAGALAGKLGRWLKEYNDNE